MSKNFSSLRSVGTVLLIAAALGVRLYSLVSGKAGVLDNVFYLFILTAVILVAWECFQHKSYARVFMFENRFHLNVFSYLAAFGFFAEFISLCHMIYQSIESGAYNIFSYFAPQCLICVSALLSSFYLCAVALSFGSKRYDFRTMRLIHLVPLIWAIGRMLTLIENVDTLQGNPNTVVKYAVLVFALCFTFMLAYEVERTEGAKRITVFFTRAFSLLAEIFFFDSLMLLLAGKTKLNAPDTVLSFSLLLISSFAFFLEKSIISNSNTENN